MKRKMISITEDSWIVLQDICKMEVRNTSPVTVRITTIKDGVTHLLDIPFVGTLECAREWCKGVGREFNKEEG